MKKNLLFLGNNGNLICEFLKHRDINLIGVVADRVSDEINRYFGSSFLIAEEHKIPCVSQKTFKTNRLKLLENTFKNINLIFSQGYQYRITEDVINVNSLKIINFHQSLLPEYAGRHPLNWVIVNGERKTGITFHYVRNNFDDGEIILQKSIEISKDDNVVTLYNKTIRDGTSLINDVIQLAYDRDFTPRKQDLSKRTYFPPRKSEDGEITREDLIEDIKNKIRALATPYPGAFIKIDGKEFVLEKVKDVKDTRKYKNVEFADKINGSVIIRAKDGLLEGLERTQTGCNK